MNDQELDALNKIVTAYLDIAEVQALNHEPMYMKDWLKTIDDYLKMTRRSRLLKEFRQERSAPFENLFHYLNPC